MSHIDPTLLQAAATGSKFPLQASLVGFNDEANPVFYGKDSTFTLDASDLSDDLNDWLASLEIPTRVYFSAEGVIEIIKHSKPSSESRSTVTGSANPQAVNNTF